MAPSKRIGKATKLKTLYRKRSNILHSAALIQTFDAEYVIGQANQLPIRIQHLDELWREFEGVQDKIEDLEDEEGFSEDRREFQNLYYTLKASLTSKVPPPITASSSRDASNFQPHSIPNLRLPEIKLKEFSGNYDEWESFSDLFVSLIHSNPQLTMVQKLHYLRASVIGEAARMIAPLDLTANNYLVAWNLLKERYENKHMLIKRHMAGLLLISPLKKESATGLLDLADEFDRHVQLLDKLENAEDHWNSFLVERLSSYLDPASLREWETQSAGEVKPDYKKILDFIRKRSRILQTLMLSQPITAPTIENKPKPRAATAHVSSTSSAKCACCKQQHMLFQCDQFNSLTPPERFDVVKKNGLCINCMKGTHLAKDCTSGTCKTCSKRHHTLLHLTSPVSTSDHQEPPQHSFLADSNNPQNNPPYVSVKSSRSGELRNASPLVSSSFEPSSSFGYSPPSSSVVSSVQSLPPTAHQAAKVSQQQNPSSVLLSTAVIRVLDADNNYHYARALLDSGSQPSFISEALCQRLNLKRTKVHSPVSGIGQSMVNVRYSVTVSIASRFGDFAANLDCLVLPKLTVALPSYHIDVTCWQIPRHLLLADPQFNVSQGVDVIIGAELFYSLLENQQISLGIGYPLLQKTVFGFVVCGKVAESANTVVVQSSHVCTEESLDSQLERFWEIENFDSTKAYTEEEQLCEGHFRRTVSRDDSGRFVVRLPMREELVPRIGDSYTPALRRFLSIEKKFCCNENFRQEYRKVMEEYQRLGHMEVNSRVLNGPQFFLPHHAIHRPDSTTTKTRVVFDASSRGINGVSLNDILMIGPTVQPSLQAIILNFRMPRYVFSADAQKMFQQIWVHPEDRKFQQTLWRDHPSEPIRIYQMKTVMYGLASSPFLATRVLNQLATDDGANYPLAVPVIRKGTYVDDVLTGDDDLCTIQETCAQLIALLGGAGFVLRKWAANNQAVLANVPSEMWETANSLEIDRPTTVKALGLIWVPQADMFMFKIPEFLDTTAITKRVVVSEMARLFDPIGFLGPIVLNAKIFVQTLWAEHLPWDQELPESAQMWWKAYRTDIQQLNPLQIPRRILANSNRQYSLHCFCDASTKGYGCCIYLVSPDANGELHCHLLTSKSRVAPLRGHSVPRLELCAALLGSQCIDNLRKTTEYNVSATMWTDSTIVLHWLRSRSSNWKVFVSNRVAEVQRLTKELQWRHVPTDANPADRISRGCPASRIIKDDLWWHGPHFLKLSKELWPDSAFPEPADPDIQEETRSVVALHVSSEEDTLFSRFSELAKLLKCLAYCFRFSTNCQLPKAQRSFGPLSPDECDRALKALVRLAQHSSFPIEVNSYTRQQRPSTLPSPKSPLRGLNIFMDENGLLRIDGRVRYANIPYDTRFPILLPSDHKLSLLIARAIHIKTLHGGPSLILATMRQRFWPLRGRDLARRTVRRCVTCFRCQPKSTTQIMAPLPAVRLTQARPFLFSGMDYCGPFFIRPLNGRGASVKMYVALFICLVVKAVHIEIVADLTAVSCVNAVKRIVGRRGRIQELYCDNATAFVGADRELSVSRKQFLQQFKEGEWRNYCLDSGIKFCFIPARSPHFGGIWEAGIKSFKHHFRRIMGLKAFSIDQFHTVVTQVEAVLNSRPLSPLTDSPDDLAALTPGHFLIGEPLVAIPEPDLSHINPGRLSRLQDMKKALQDLWVRWSRDYVSHLHQRTKWKKQQDEVQVGQLVLLKENTPPLHWPLGRIVETIPGKDGHIRVVIVKTSSGQYKRAITEVSVLPTDEEQSDNHKVATGSN